MVLFSLFGSYSVHYVHFGNILSIRSYSVHFSSIWSILSTLVQFGPLWSTLVLFGRFSSIRSTLILFCPIMSYYVHFGLFVSISVHFCALKLSLLCLYLSLPFSPCHHLLYLFPISISTLPYNSLRQCHVEKRGKKLK